MTQHSDRRSDPERSAGPVEWSSLPETVRLAAISLAAQALGSIPVAQLPTMLVPVARFTQSKRARRGAVPLARVLRSDSAFRALVAQFLPSGESADDVAHHAARAYLTRDPDLASLLTEAARADELVALRARVAELSESVDALTARLASATAPNLGEEHVRAGPPPSESSEIKKLTGRLRAQGTRVKSAEEAARAAGEAAEQVREQAAEQRRQDQTEIESWRSKAMRLSDRADALQRVIDRMREESDRARADVDRRSEILLDALQEAAAGLRYEWHLATGGADPADVIAERLAHPVGLAERAVDEHRVMEWLTAPAAHLVVDGYNVTKTGYPELSLAEQRERLVRELAPLRARTGADMTVVFDGADVVAPGVSAIGPASRVRVIFSPPSVIADDVIRDLVAAEPRGRMLIVATSDRAVVDDVRRAGARSVSSALLLAVLG